MVQKMRSAQHPNTPNPMSHYLLPTKCVITAAESAITNTKYRATPPTNQFYRTVTTVIDTVNKSRAEAKSRTVKTSTTTYTATESTTIIASKYATAAYNFTLSTNQMPCR